MARTEIIRGTARMTLVLGTARCMVSRRSWTRRNSDVNVLQEAKLRRDRVGLSLAKQKRAAAATG